MCKIGTYQPFCIVCGSAITGKLEQNTNLEYQPEWSMIPCNLALFLHRLCPPALPPGLTDNVLECLHNANNTFEETQLQLAAEKDRLSEAVIFCPHDSASIALIAENIKILSEQLVLPFKINIGYPIDQGYSQRNIIAERTNVADSTSWTIHLTEDNSDELYFNKLIEMPNYEEVTVATLEGVCRGCEWPYYGLLGSGNFECGTSSELGGVEETDSPGRMLRTPVSRNIEPQVFQGRSGFKESSIADASDQRVGARYGLGTTKGEHEYTAAKSKSSKRNLNSTSVGRSKGVRKRQRESRHGRRRS